MKSNSCAPSRASAAGAGGAAAAGPTIETIASAAQAASILLIIHSLKDADVVAAIGRARHAKGEVLGQARLMLSPDTLPPLVSIRAFEAAARHGSFAAAARELGTTAASISYHV